MYNVQTLSGNVVASNIAATHYGKAAWTAAPRLATLWYHAVDALSSVVGAEDASQPEAKVTPEMGAGLRSLAQAVQAASAQVEGKEVTIEEATATRSLRG